MRSAGLLQRRLEEMGLPTVSISNQPELTEKVCVPRAVFIQYPFARILGDVGDRNGQRAVCDDMVEMMQKATGPNTYRHLPYEWPEPPEKTKWKPDIPTPIAEILKQGKLDPEAAKKNMRDDEREGVT